MRSASASYYPIASLDPGPISTKIVHNEAASYMYLYEDLELDCIS